MSNNRSKGVVANSDETQPIALVYRGKAGCCHACSEALKTLLESATRWNFNVKYVGPDGEISVEEGLQISDAVLYAQPGGNGSLKDAFDKELNEYALAVREFVSNGGRYLGTCMGAYLVGNDYDFPGYDLGLKVGQYIDLPDATVSTEDDSRIQVLWRGKERYMYFQDGPYFMPNSSVKSQIILAYYISGEVAAMVQQCGSGWIGVVGTHPEADETWYEEANLKYPGSTADLGRDLIDTLMMQ